MSNIKILKRRSLLSLLSLVLALSLPGAFAKPTDPDMDVLDVKPLAPTARLTSLDPVSYTHLDVYKSQVLRRGTRRNQLGLSRQGPRRSVSPAGNWQQRS